MFGNRDIPTYLFTGFLESGKTSCIIDVIKEGNFSDGQTTLLLITEEGQVEFDDVLLASNKIIPAVIEDESELTEEKCKKFVKEFKPARIVIEVNGMWDLDKLFNETLPENWTVVQTFTTVNAETFDLYLNNMKSLFMSHFQIADLVIFNRSNTNMDRASMRRNVKAINRMAQVLFESVDGSVESNIEEELPYDINQNEIELEDDDFGLWYLDACEHPEKYAGKTVIFKGQVYRNRTFPLDVFVPARAAMTCCADDIAKIGFICHYKDAAKYKTNTWIKVKAKIKNEFSPGNQGMLPVLYASEIKEDKPPKEEVVYFS